MTYLELLNRIKNGTQPKIVLFKDEIYTWCGTDYGLSYNSDDHIHDQLSETEMISTNCIFEIRIVGNDDVE